MTYPVVAIVNTLLKRAEKKKVEGMTPMKIQKLLYYAQAWYLKINNNIPLIDEYFSRWRYGPVIPSLYHSLKKYGAETAEPIADFEIYEGEVTLKYLLIENDSIDAFLDRILDVYGPYSAQQLSNMTHQKDTAWANGGGGNGSVISPTDMIQEIS